MLKNSEAAGLADFRADGRLLVLAGLALPIGAIGACVAKVLLWLIAWITNLSYFHRASLQPVTPQQAHGGWAMIFIPVAGALLIGLMARYGSEKIRGHGIPEALEAILLGKSLINPRVAILKPLSSAISIGTGGPFGAEGPIIMTGGAFGSLFAQMFHLTAAERKILLVAGAAAGMSAIFATPVAAVLLAVELLLFEWRPRSFIPVGVAAMAAAAVRVHLLGNGPIFPVPLHGELGLGAVMGGLAVGLAAGFGSWALTSLIYAVEDGFARLPIHWMWWPALGSLVVGVGGWLDPRVLGVGYGSIHSLMLGQCLGAALVSLLVIKAIVWVVALGSGTSGGVLAPLLILGGALGVCVGHWLPGGDPGLWALAGMAAMMGGTMRSPLTGLFFALELTRDFNAAPVLFAGCLGALAVTVLALPRSILTEKLARRGQHISRDYTVDPFDQIRVGEVMDSKVPCVSGQMSVMELSEQISARELPLGRRHAAFIVDTEGRLEGLVTRGDLLQALRQDPTGQSAVAAVGRKRVVTVFPDERVADAIGRMLRHDIGRMPVVSREDPGRVVGYLGRADILSARERTHEEEEERSCGPWMRQVPIKHAA